MRDSDDERAATGNLRLSLAFGVHLFTAMGAALALLAMLAAVEQRWSVMFAWLAVALVVDAIDGTFARLLHVKALVPRWSGDVLDLVVDILTYVFVPTFALVTSGLLPPALALPLGIAVTITSVLYFSDRTMKSGDNHFVGFPAVWNLVAFLLFLTHPPAWVSALAVILFCVLTFVPLKFVHPFRVVRLRSLNLVLMVVALVLAVLALLSNLQPGLFVTVPLCMISLYFLVAGLQWRNAR